MKNLLKLLLKTLLVNLFFFITFFLLFSSNANAQVEECGAQGQMCCLGPLYCDTGLECNFDTNICVPAVECGAQGQMCCLGPLYCDSGLTCNFDTNICEPAEECGAQNQMCCLGPLYCDFGLECNFDTNICVPAVECGAQGQMCCLGPLYCDSGLTCNFDTNICEAGVFIPPPPIPTINFPALYTATGFDFGGSTVGDVISVLLRYLFPIAGLLLLIYLLYGGYNLMFSAGDPKKASAARGIITNALTGMVLIFAAYWIIQIVARILGLGQIAGMFG